jgi:uncharacterized membrane protein (DUF441 family)
MQVPVARAIEIVAKMVENISESTLCGVNAALKQSVSELTVGLVVGKVIAAPRYDRIAAGSIVARLANV